MKLHYSLFLVPCSLFIFASCSVSKKISKQAGNILLNDSAIRSGHIGISIYEPATNTYWYNHNATKYFVPASNTKLFTLYAGMKYLGDSLVAARVELIKDKITIHPSGDPTFLNSEFRFQPLLNYLKNAKSISINNNAWASDALGNGWAWNDYTESYMAERSSFPVYGNLVSFSLKNNTIEPLAEFINLLSNERYESPVKFNPETMAVQSNHFNIERAYGNNNYYIKDANAAFTKRSMPFHGDPEFVADLLKDTLKVDDLFFFTSGQTSRSLPNGSIIRSQPSDSLFKPMMHRSDNFYAEQTLLMASNEKLGYMNDEKIIDTILRADLKDIPQRPRWVDGSGLSRYNLFTPQSFVYILNKMKNEFGWDRLKNILPTGGTGTLFSYYKNEAGFIYAKTGTLSNNCALSGFLVTKKGKLLVFSVLASNYQTGATPVRKAVEKFLVGIREKY
ncbi:MAG TPA: D-alanyl-D-alanine carboxypeptidase/D-alanyl-D-alanine-endopeptidase [Ferruginibacter sp.]|nr:D-alanyl-D-alanine carboxypeptidase/D-alanyl-D-alanine-endopeptidase [Ferruginibacter sp.]